MALNGINLPLAFTAQEAIWLKVYKQVNCHRTYKIKIRLCVRLSASPPKYSNRSVYPSPGLSDFDLSEHFIETL